MDNDLSRQVLDGVDVLEMSLMHIWLLWTPQLGIVLLELKMVNGLSGQHEGHAGSRCS